MTRFDASRTVAVGGSQGGGITIAVGGLVPDLAGVAPDVPFLCDFPRAATLTDRHPYREIGLFLKTHRGRTQDVLRTLSYFDGVNLAPRATAPALFSVGLMDPVCPPSTVFATYHRYGGEREIETWRFADHAGGMASQARRQLRWLHERGLGPAS